MTLITTLFVYICGFTFISNLDLLFVDNSCVTYFTIFTPFSDLFFAARFSSAFSIIFSGFLLAVLWNCAASHPTHTLSAPHCRYWNFIFWLSIFISYLKFFFFTCKYLDNLSFPYLVLTLFNTPEKKNLHCTSCGYII